MAWLPNACPCLVALKRRVGGGEGSCVNGLFDACVNGLFDACLNGLFDGYVYTYIPTKDLD